MTNETIEAQEPDAPGVPDVANTLDPHLLEPDNRTRPCMTVAEIARTLHVSKMTIYRLIEAGQLAHYQIGYSIRVTPNDFLAFLARGRHEARA